MPRRTRQSKDSGAIVAAVGKKITFDVEEGDAGPSTNPFESTTPANESRAETSTEALEDDHDDDDDDDAPEEAGVALSRARETQESSRVERLDKAKKDAARLRSQRVEAIKRTKKATNEGPSHPKSRQKAQGATSGLSGQSLDDEDPEQRRLRFRMERAMEDGSGDSEDSGSDDNEDGDLDENEEDGSEEDDEGDMGSFHTESEGDDDDMEEDEDDSESEELVDGPLSGQDRRMRALMDQAMAAADKRAGIVHLSKSPKASSSNLKASLGSASSTVKDTQTDRNPVDVEEETMWDLSTGVGNVKPLSAAVLAAAAKAEQEDAARARAKENTEAQKRAREIAGTKRQKKRRKMEITDKSPGDGKSLHLLAPQLDLLPGALPPLQQALPGSRPGKDARLKFIQKAMKVSGQIPGKGLVDGRKAAARIRSTR